MTATEPPTSRPLTLLARVLGTYALLVGSITAVGWFTRVKRLTDWDGDGIVMFFNTALMSVCAGAALLSLSSGKRRAVIASRVLAAIVLCFGAATLVEHISGVSLGIDTAFVREPWGTRAATMPGRPGPPAAVSFTLLGFAMLLASGGRRARALVPPLGTVILSLGMLATLGYLFGASLLFSIAHLTGVAMGTATTILSLAAGLLAIVPEREPMRTLCGSGVASALARRALPVVIILPMVLGWMRLAGQERQLYDLRMGTALLVLALIALLIALLWWCLGVVAEHESRLRAKEAALVAEITERSRTEQSLARRAHEQSALYHFTDQLHRAASLDEIFAAALESIVEALRCDRASVLLFDEAGVMRFVASRGLSDSYRTAVEGHSPWKPGDADAQPICIDDLAKAELPEALKAVIDAEGIGALGFIPLIAGGKLTGKFMTYYDAPHAFTRDELDLAIAIARQLGFSIARMQAEKALVRSEELLRSITDHSADLIFVKDRESRTVFINPAGVRMSGLPATRILGRTDAEIYPEFPEQAAGFIAGDLRVMASRQEETVEEQARTATGETFTLLTTKTPRLDADGNVIGVIGISRDITERKCTEERLREAARQAQEASRAKDDFLAALSHELRTPLTPALMAATALEHDEALPGDAREQLAMIRRNIQLEARLIDDLLDLTRVSHGKLTMQAVVTDLDELIHHARETVGEEAAAKQLRLSFTLDALEHHVSADPARLQQVLWNLFKNAVKFTPAGGSVAVRTSNPQPGRVLVQVVDTGIGIAPAALGRIFHAFDQGELGGRHQFGGLGLGLAISKAIVDAHGGALRAESGGAGSGAAFSLELATVPASASAVPVAESDARPAPLRLLVVEDHAPTLATMSHLLERDGHSVLRASSVSEALALAKTNECDLVISDLGLPDGSGLDLMSEIRRSRGWPGIALSGFGMEADVRASDASGFAVHLVKPVDIARLREVIAATMTHVTV